MLSKYLYWVISLVNAAGLAYPDANEPKYRITESILVGKFKFHLLVLFYYMAHFNVLQLHITLCVCESCDSKKMCLIFLFLLMLFLRHKQS